MGQTLVIIVIFGVVVTAGVIIAGALAYSKHYFACGNCGAKFQPKWTNAILVYHVFDEHLLKCPHCNTTSMCTGKGKKYKTIVSGASKIRGEQMKKLNSKQLKTIRIFIIIIGILISFVIWLFLPDVINNNALFHVGNGKYGSKLGALLLVLIPLFGFIPGRMDEEIHTKDSMERVELKEKFDKRSEEIQIAVAFFCSVVACLAMLCGLALC